MRRQELLLNCTGRTFFLNLKVTSVILHMLRFKEVSLLQLMCNSRLRVVKLKLYANFNKLCIAYLQIRYVLSLIPTPCSDWSAIYLLAWSPQAS